jgi:hypothetical protein
MSEPLDKAIARFIANLNQERINRKQQEEICTALSAMWLNAYFLQGINPYGGLN